MRISLIAIIVAAARAAHAGPTVAPASIDLGTIHGGDVKTFTFRLTNGGSAPLKGVACRGKGFTFAPAKLTIAPGAGADVTATYREKKTLKLLGRLDTTITCSGTKLVIAGIWWNKPARDDRPTDAASLAHVIAARTSVWSGNAYSPSKGMIASESCGSPMQGDEDTCCVISLDDLAGASKATYVRKSDDCSRKGARTPDDIARELTGIFTRDGWVAIDDENWIGDARLLPDGRMLAWHDGAIWLGDKQVATTAEPPGGLGFTLDLKTMVVRTSAGWVPLAMP